MQYHNDGTLHHEDTLVLIREDDDAEIAEVARLSGGSFGLIIVILEKGMPTHYWHDGGDGVAEFCDTEMEDPYTFRTVAGARKRLAKIQRDYGKVSFAGWCLPDSDLNPLDKYKLHEREFKGGHPRT